MSSRTTLNPPVFFSSSLIIICLVLYSILFKNHAQQLFAATQDWIVTNASWVYIMTVAIILLSATFLALSRYGDIKLGPDHSEPDYNTCTWFSMLFCAGMGIGLMFFGVAEPLMHFMSPPVGEPRSIEAAQEAMKLTFFHWGLHAWAIYTIVGLILAYFCYRHNLPLTLRSALYPLIGQRIYGPIGHVVDTFALICTVLGVSTSLGYGVLQINTGLNHLYGLPISTTVQIGVLVCTMSLATLSVVIGLDRGLRRLSELNMLLAVGLLLVVLLLGPTVFILQTLVQNTGGYLSEIVSKTFNLYAYKPTDWIGGWTLFYWGWWLSWSPFVGLFIARISRGRTIRQFISGVMLVPAGFTLFWMTVFGDAAIHMTMIQGITDLADAVNKDSSLALFAFLEHFPFSAVLSQLAVLMIVVFFVTSADSGAMVVDMLASGGCEKTPVWQRMFWAIVIAAVGAALLLADGLKALQTATIASALPFVVALMASLWGLLRALHLDATKRGLRQQVSLSYRSGQSPGGWQRRLRSMVLLSRRTHVTRFIHETVLPACQQVAEEFRKQGREALVESGDEGCVILSIHHGNEADFHYQVKPKSMVQPNFKPEENCEERKYFRAEVHLGEGGQDYDVMGWNREEVIGDILDQYERHMQFLHMTR